MPPKTVRALFNKQTNKYIATWRKIINRKTTFSAASFYPDEIDNKMSASKIKWLEVFNASN